MVDFTEPKFLGRKKDHYVVLDHVGYKEFAPTEEIVQRNQLSEPLETRVFQDSASSYWNILSYGQVLFADYIDLGLNVEEDKSHVYMGESFNCAAFYKKSSTFYKGKSSTDKGSNGVS